MNKNIKFTTIFYYLALKCEDSVNDNMGIVQKDLGMKTSSKQNALYI